MQRINLIVLFSYGLLTIFAQSRTYVLKKKNVQSMRIEINEKDINPTCCVIASSSL